MNKKQSEEKKRIAKPTAKMVEKLQNLLGEFSLIPDFRILRMMDKAKMMYVIQKVDLENKRVKRKTIEYEKAREKIVGLGITMEERDYD